MLVQPNSCWNLDSTDLVSSYYPVSKRHNYWRRPCPTFQKSLKPFWNVVTKQKIIWLRHKHAARSTTWQDTFLTSELALKSIFRITKGLRAAHNIAWYSTDGDPSMSGWSLIHVWMVTHPYLKCHPSMTGWSLSKSGGSCIHIWDGHPSMSYIAQPLFNYTSPATDSIKMTRFEAIIQILEAASYLHTLHEVSFWKTSCFLCSWSYY